MRRIMLVMVGLVLALAPGMATRAGAFCGPDEGCSPCPLFEISVDKRGVHITPIYC